ncbi:hypothetical protein [Micromonospora inyonensis]|uniref:Uncharacterized protein n=1 Tax=Micromonospora inyonensis TaxID=47866 RepID=A0A1C6SSB1_9ACTN|nr:hypothetical protein [Micromonospora inyonensis]SCL20466.1 hypothetical protein GA0074694_3046 [Micromonospora inyonensis]SCL25462.1 hypothetical protein GA0074694_4227 [Micromonospora inyonensis]SCL32249.1 hypothetical protein GA0074694_6207 [Micromonospora inyonensis]
MQATLTAIAIGTLAALGYAVSCAVWPFARCWVCDGKAHHTPKGNTRISRPCRWCKATGRRLRLGRRVWNRIRVAHHNGTR